MTSKTTRCWLFTVLVAALGCATAPLDPRTAASGGPQTALAAATDVLAYELELEVFPQRRALAGVGTTIVRALEPVSAVELQLDARFEVPEVTVGGRPAAVDRSGGRLRIALPAPLQRGEEATVAVTYRGKPWVARRAPWDGGIVWSATRDGKPWIATAVQGEGCDLWWPCKDQFQDKPERMSIAITVPAGLAAATNGRLAGIDELADGRRRFRWQVGAPLSDYNVALNIGPFVRIEETYAGVNGASIPLEFWALPEHEAKVRTLVAEDLRPQLQWYERTLGPYPWGTEKLGFVSTPHLGMEHQTINAYGNDFRRDDFGFDRLLQHELAHEWFGNLVTHARINDAWIHEGFGAYMQPAYTLDRNGDAAYAHRMYETYLGIANCKPVVQEGDLTSEEVFTGDIYAKGSFALHTLRWLLGDEAFWRATRVLLYDTPEPWQLAYPIAPRYRSTDDVVRIFSEVAGRDLAWLFDAYLRHADLPRLEETRRDGELVLRWSAPGGGPFPMPVVVRVDGVDRRVEMAEGQSSLQVPTEARVVIDPDMKVLRWMPILRSCKELEAERAERHAREARRAARRK